MPNPPNLAVCSSNDSRTIWARRIKYPNAHRNLHRALLVDEELADQVWGLWDRGVIGDQLVLIAWMLIVTFYAKQPCRRD